MPERTLIFEYRGEIFTYKRLIETKRYFHNPVSGDKQVTIHWIVETTSGHIMEIDPTWIKGLDPQ